MLILLPLFAFLVIFINLLGFGRTPEQIHGQDPSEALLKATLLWGILVTLLSEGLSLLHAIDQTGLALGWSAVVVGLCVLGLRRGILPAGWRQLWQVQLPAVAYQRSLLAAIALILLLLLVIALVAPPNNNDSLQYHMSRVAHWAQNRSLDHYAASFHAQLWSPTWAEAAILNLRVLWGNDRPANLVQWFSMLASLVGVAYIAGRLGIGRRGRLLAVASCASIPMGLLQASSTQNDYVAAFWLVCAANFALPIQTEGKSDRRGLWMAIALGLGIATKATFYPYALPFGLWWLVSRRFGLQIRRLLMEGIAMLAIVTLLNAGFWIRNIITYSGPLGPREWIQAMTNRRIGIRGSGASLLNQVALNFATPSEQINEGIIAGVRSFSRRIGAGASPFNLQWSWNHEDLAGSPLHFALVPISFAILTTVRTRKPLAFTYSLVTLASFMVFAVVVGFDVFGARHHLPFLVMWAPVVGLAGSQFRHVRLPIVLASLFLAASLPWVLFNRTRPLIGWYPRTTTESILNEPKYAVLLANWPELRDPYRAVAAQIRNSGCRAIGLRIDSHDLEYAFWWLLEAPQSGRRVEVVDPLQSLQRYADPTFKPCAVICTICGERAELYNLDLEGDYGPVKLFSGSGYIGEWDD